MSSIWWINRASEASYGEREMADRYVFVYGSLRKGEHNNPHFMPDSEFVGEGVVVDHLFKLSGYGTVPAATIAEDGDFLVGEVWKCPRDDYQAVRNLEVNAGYEEVTVTVSYFTEYDQNHPAFITCLMYCHHGFGVEIEPNHADVLEWPRRR